MVVVLVHELLGASDLSRRRVGDPQAGYICHNPVKLKAIMCIRFFAEFERIYYKFNLT